jgi:hypothetical protein
MPSAAIEVEVDSEKNGDVIFPPLSRRVRGRFDVTRAVKTDGNAGELFKTWPLPIPGQRIGLDVLTRTGYVYEPLHESEYAPIAEQVKKRFTLPPERETMPAHVPTWLHWLKRIVESGSGRVVVGILPDTIDGEPNLDFKAPPDNNARLAEAIEKQTEVFSKLLAELVAKRK